MLCSEISADIRAGIIPLTLNTTSKIKSPLARARNLNSIMICFAGEGKRTYARHRRTAACPRYPLKHGYRGQATVRQLLRYCVNPEYNENQLQYVASCHLFIIIIHQADSRFCACSNLTSPPTIAV